MITAQNIFVIMQKDQMADSVLTQLVTLDMEKATEWLVKNLMIV